MASRRKPLTYPELDNLEPRGKGAILRSAEEISAEQAQLHIEIEELSIPENKISRNLERKKTGIQVGRKSLSLDDVKLPQSPSLSPEARSSYKKSTYRLRPEALEALEDAKRFLRRRYGVKVNLEVIVEEAILEAYRDLVRSPETSLLVNKFSRNQEIKKT